ncbi:thermonuclease family protein [Ciceribacter sp. L1K22]|uniref:thermonuclease family protein n=1 Tax=Ciceribacter sp. L1K22 TaxID=2820275 RepID=UPI001ABE7CD7|nr:thermonuclease family protein [Ciceribacter sp. L1K22]MBO3758462.1 thermonuclease family protein [Ciceribacter sp. L1K22]
MRLLGTVGVGLAGVLVMAVLMVGAGERLRDRPSAPAPADETPAPAAAAAVIETRNARPIDPARFAAPFAEGATALERIASRQPEPKPTARVAVVLLPRPVSLEVGLFRSGDRIVRLRGLEPLAPSTVCDAPRGGSWPCGMVALTRQRMLVRNRTIACDNGTEGDGAEMLTTCRVGNADIGLWLAENGWAKPISGSGLEAAGEAAKASTKGLWGSDPRVAGSQP